MAALQSGTDGPQRSRNAPEQPPPAMVQQHAKIKVELVTRERTPTDAIEIEPGVIEQGATLILFEPPLDA
jgi:hypothetical protein